MPADFEEKRQRRIERLQNVADRAASEANTEYQAGHELASHIPFGQPILVGHHSEKRDRRYHGRIEGHFRKGAELQEKSEYYAVGQEPP